MRFLMPSVPAGRLEYVIIMVLSWAATYWTISELLALNVNVETLQISYAARNVALAAIILTVIFAVQILLTMRRLTEVGMKTPLAFMMLIPSLNILMPLSLMFKTRPNNYGKTPYGDDPLDPQSWVAPVANPGPVASYQGQELRLPGDEERERAA